MKGDGGAIGSESDSEGQGLLLLLSLHIKRIQKVSYCLFFFFKNTPNLINLSLFLKHKNDVNIVN